MAIKIGPMIFMNFISFYKYLHKYRQKAYIYHIRSLLTCEGFFMLNRRFLVIIDAFRIDFGCCSIIGICYSPGSFSSSIFFSTDKFIYLLCEWHDSAIFINPQIKRISPLINNKIIMAQQT
jgi:hypothetical protein